MNKHVPHRIARSVCPHDCPSTCALDVELLDDRTIGRVRGAVDDPYTAGVICEKVARYAERIHHPKRLLHPLRRTGPKGSGQFQQIGWDEALDEIVARFKAAADEHGPETVWPYFYAGTMGHVQRDGIERLTHAMGYSRFYSTICDMVSSSGYIAGTGLNGGVSPEEMAKAECIVIWGTNPVHTQVNVMTHAMRAKKRGAKIVVVDIYRTATMQQADLGLMLRPGTDGALALAVMHVLLEEELADRDFLSRFTDFSEEFESHLKDKTPDWAASITGLSVGEITSFARLVGRNKASYFRLGYGFTRQRNGATNMHAALCIPAMTGAWAVLGGGALHSNSGTWGLDKSAITGPDLAKGTARSLDQSAVGAILTGDSKALKNGPPVTAMLVQNTNPAVVVPDQTRVREGLMREDLFLCVHEQFMTETAEFADIVLPATMFLEHNDYYTRGGHTRILYGPKIVDAPGEARPNLDVVNELARRLGVGDAVQFGRTDTEMVAETFRRSGFGDPEDFMGKGYVERARASEKAHFAEGFGWPDGRFRFAPDWSDVRVKKSADFVCDPADLPRYADFWDINEKTDAEHPFKLATSPARGFLNSTFNETPGSQRREGPPSLLVHPADAAELGTAEGELVKVGNRRGELSLTVRLFDGLPRGVVIAESIHPNKAHKEGRGINTLIGADSAPPFGGAAFHDAAVWVLPGEA